MVRQLVVLGLRDSSDERVLKKGNSQTRLL